MPVRLQSILLQNWKNFRSAEMQFRDITVIIGPNASGKSNILDSLRFLRQIAEVGGGLQDAVSDRGGVSAIRSLAARKQPEISLEAKFSSDDDLIWTYKLVIRQNNQRVPLVFEETVTKGGVKILERPLKEDRQDEARLSQTHLEQINANQEFREIADYLQSVKYLHVIPQLVREPERYGSRSARKNDEFGQDFLESIATTQARVRDSRLKRIQKALQVAVPQLTELELERDNLGVPHLKGRFVHWRPNAGWQKESQFSDGTLRLIGLLWATLDGQGPLLLEEPELSLHSNLITHLPEMFLRLIKGRRRQIILTTHARELLESPAVDISDIYLIRAASEGSELVRASEIDDITIMNDADIPIGDVLVGKAAPEGAFQLSLL